VLLATLCFTLAHAFVSLHPSGFKANYLDAVSAHRSGLASGVGNTLASLASFVGQLAVGWMLDSSSGGYGSWTPVFLSVAACNTLAAAAFGVLSTASPVDSGPPLPPQMSRTTQRSPSAQRAESESNGESEGRSVAAAAAVPTDAAKKKAE
jgi:hypothetical protein